ncbi:UNVERIFIED_ORG: hypothetical protein ABIB52_004515 [Arthrobacter sp. UYCu721]
MRAGPLALSGQANVCLFARPASAPPRSFFARDGRIFRVLPVATATVKRPFCKKLRFVIPARVLLLGFVMGSCFSGSTAVGRPGTCCSDGTGGGDTLHREMRNGDVARITIVSVVRTETVTTTSFASPKNGTYLLLDVLWETEAGKASSNPFYFLSQG